MLNRLFTSRRIFVCLLAMGVTTLLGACGGGGGGTVYPDLSYTGATGAAVINETNADDFPFVALEGSSGSGDIFRNLPVGASIEPEFSEGIPDPENIKKAANIIGDLIKNQMSHSPLVSGATESIVGNCAGGGGKATLTGNDTGEIITASLRLDNYCVVDGSGGYVSLYGLMNISISYTGDYNFTDFIMSIQYLKMSVSDGSTTVSEEFAGTIKITGIDPGPPTFSVSVNFKYEGKIYKIENLAVVEVNITNISISGKLYHPVHGYEVIATDVADPFVFDNDTEQFCNGTLHLTGEDLSGNIAVIRFTDPDTYCTAYNICISVNGGPEDCDNGVTWGDPAWPAPAIPAIPAP